MVSLETRVPIDGTLGKVDNTISYTRELQIKGFSRINGIQD